MKINDKTYRVITPEEGCLLTTYKEEDDILTYDSCKIVYQPLSADPNIYRDVTIAEDEAYKAQKAAKESE